LILTGLYNSAVSVARDVKLRRSIKSSALLQSSELLDSIGTAQITKEIEDKVALYMIILIGGIPNSAGPPAPKKNNRFTESRIITFDSIILNIRL
jgi:hypothetical protein